MKAYVRRQDIWHTLNRNRYTTVADLAAQYGVSQRTIYYDLQILSLTHPNEAAGGRQGGFKVADWHKPKPSAFQSEALALLSRCRDMFSGKDAIILESIIDKISCSS